jgi:hypothetical protein
MWYPHAEQKKIHVGSCLYLPRDASGSQCAYCTISPSATESATVQVQQKLFRKISIAMNPPLDAAEGLHGLAEVHFIITVIVGWAMGGLISRPARQHNIATNQLPCTIFFGIQR